MTKLLIFFSVFFFPILSFGQQQNEEMEVQTYYGWQKGFALHRNIYFVRVIGDTAYFCDFVTRGGRIMQDNIWDTILVKQGDAFVGEKVTFVIDYGKPKLYISSWRNGKKPLYLTDDHAAQLWRYKSNMLFWERNGCSVNDFPENKKMDWPEIWNWMYTKEPQDFKSAIHEKFRPN